MDTRKRSLGPFVIVVALAAGSLALSGSGSSAAQGAKAPATPVQLRPQAVFDGAG